MNTQEFQAAVNTKATGPKPEQDVVAVVDELSGRIAEAIRKATDLGLTGSELAGLRSRIIREAEGRWMRTRYATVDLAFTDAKQTFLVGRTEDDPSKLAIIRRIVRAEQAGLQVEKTQTTVTLPVFVTEWNEYERLKSIFDPAAQYRPRETFSTDCGSMPAARVGGVHYRAMDIRAQARIPAGITPKLFARVRRCLAFLGLFDTLLLDRDITEPRNHSDRTEVGVLWAPADDAWSFSMSAPRPAGDPAVLVRRNGGECYLVGFYDTPDEKPIDNLIREFSRGPLGNI